jgi:ubiquinone/menaquinone biosynthesis C-methylase UbiE
VGEIIKSKDFRKHVVYFYNKFAGLYDLTEFFRNGTREAMVNASGCKSGDRVLDVCTGTGELALAFARHSVTTVAVDLARGMLKVGKHKSSFEHLHFLETDATRLPFQNKSFNVVAISLALHHMPEYVQIDVMKEMARLASHKVIMVEWHAPNDPFKQTLKGFLVQMIDESEYMQEWMHQDFSATCGKAGLEVEQEEVLTMGFHRITVCSPKDSNN